MGKTPADAVKSALRLAAAASHSEVLLVVVLVSPPPEVAPPAPLQTQDGSAVAKKEKQNGHNSCSFSCLVCFFFGGLFSWLRTVPEKTNPSLTLFFQKKKTKQKTQQRTTTTTKKKKSTFIYAKTIQQHQAKEPTGSSSTPASTIGIQAGREGVRAQPPPPPPLRGAAPGGGRGSRNYSSHFFFCASATSSICEKQEKKNGEREYIYTFVQKRHMN